MCEDKPLYPNNKHKGHKTNKERKKKKTKDSSKHFLTLTRPYFCLFIELIAKITTKKKSSN